MRTPTNLHLRALSMMAGLALASVAAHAEPADKPAGNTDESFGSRVEKPDGSVAMTVGRRLPVEWEAKVGTDVSLAEPTGATQSDRFLRGAAPDRSSGAIWGTITMPSPAPVVWDKTTVEARLDPGQDRARVGATLTRSVPIGSDVSVTIQNSYSITESIPDRPTAVPPPTATGLSTGTTDSSWAADQTVRLDIAPSGTALLAGGGASSADDQWHRKLSMEQTLFGPLKVTTSVEDAGSTVSKKSILAAFKRVW